MSWKCCTMASRIGITRSSAPISSTSVSALVHVRRLVPMPGMVTARIPFRSRPSISKAWTATSSANVESRPPEMPMTIRLDSVCFSLLAKPVDCMAKISLHVEARARGSLGTNGMEGFGRRRPIDSCETSFLTVTGTERKILFGRSFENELLQSRSCWIRSKSTSA